MNYLFIYKYSKIKGGIPVIMRHLGHGLTKRDCDTNIFILAEHQDYQTVNFIKEDGFHVYYYNLRNIIKVLISRKIDVLCAFEPYKKYFYLTLLFKLFSWRTSTNLVFCGSVSEYPNWIIKRIPFVVVWLYDHLIAVSNYAKTVSLRGKYLNKIEVIYNPVRTELYSKSRFIKYNILTIGRICSRKNYVDLIKMFDQLHKLNPKIHLDIIGGYEEVRQEYYDQIINLISSLSLKDQITFHGDVSEERKFQLLSESRIYVTTSIHEMFGITTVEAMASGLPIIAYDNSATREVVNFAGGILIENGRYDLMATAIVRLIDDMTKISDMSERGILASKQFNINIFIDKYRNLFNQ